MSSFFNLLIWNVTLATGLAIAIAVAGCLPALQRRPALRHWLWLLLLVKLITPPLIPLPILRSADAASGTELAPAAEEISNSQAVPLSAPIAVAPAESDPVDFSPTEHAADPRVASPAQAPAAVPGSSGVDWLLLLPTALLLITALLLTRGIAQTIRLWRLLAKCNNHDRRASDIAVREAAKMQLRCEPTVALVAARMSPLLLVRRGRPAIVLPAALVEQLDDEQLACVIRHELAHFVRRDHCANALAFIVVSLFWWHPVALWARREMRLAQEACCDAMVVESAPQSRRCYAETLLHVIDFLGVQRSPLPHLAAGFGEARSLKRRFEMLATDKVTHRLSRLAKALVACGAIAVSCYPVLAQSVAETQRQVDDEPKVKATPRREADVPERRGAGVQLEDTIEVTGLVTDTQGEPVANAMVLFPFGYDPGTAKPRSVRSATDQAGRFRLVISRSGLPPELKLGVLNTVWAWADGYAIGVASAPHLLASVQGQAAPIKPITIRLPQAAKTSFRAVTETGKPLVGATVVPQAVRVPNGSDPIDGKFALYAPLPDELREVTQRITDADGRVSIDVVPRAQLYNVEVVSRSHGIQSVRLPDGTKEAVLPIRAAGGVRGRLVGGPADLMRGVHVILSTSAAETTGTAHVVTDENGSFHVPAMAEGGLRIQTNLDPTQPWKLVGAGRLRVVAGVENELTLTMEKAIAVTGRLVVRGGNEPVDGAGVVIQSGDYTNRDSIVTDERGEFTTLIVPGQEAVIQVIRLDHPERTYPRPTQIRVTIPRGADAFRIPDIEIPRAKTWTGRLLDQSDRPVAGMYVQALNGATSLHYPTRTNAKGQFALRLRDDQIPDRWSALIGWRNSGSERDVSVPAEIVTETPLVLRIDLPEDHRQPSRSESESETPDGNSREQGTGTTGAANPSNAEKTRRVYFLQFADARRVHDVLSAIKQPDAVVEVEARTNQVVVQATEPQHRELAEVIKQLDLKEPPKSLAVIKMTRSDPKAVLIVVRKMFEGTTENAPKVDVDLAGRRLFVRGTPAQVRQVRNLIVGLEQLISGPGDPDDPAAGVAASTIPQAASSAEDDPFALPTAAPPITGLPESAKVTTDGDGNVVGVKLTGESNLNRLTVTPEIIDALAKLKSLRTLSLWGTTVGDREIERFTALKQLHLIDLSFTDVTGESLRTMASLKELVSVRLEGCDVKDEHLVALGDIPQLAMLYLGRTKITDLGLKHIKQLENLNLLQLSDCQITDQGLASLGHLPRIQHLWLSKTIRNGDDDRSDLTDRSIDYLISLDTLVDLQIADSQLTESGLQRLREGLPKAKVRTQRTGITYRRRAAK